MSVLPIRRPKSCQSSSGNCYRETCRTEIDGIPLELARRVERSESGRYDGSLFLVRAAGSDVEAQRVVRIATALEKKLPKLTDCAALGDTTFLILEWSDISLSNEVVISHALEKALA